ncbi:NADH-cytochrome b5 reductase [Thraustotheca clavata]|uniref:NADH-cytochrome b5 reductase n=1 Tax=Thraustotheca clavata TaxID=74557 RepID=A0A1W0A7K3_9STRA|nr:NADH-cytochrome b5 reductase [Thraustotheca clavata]
MLLRVTRQHMRKIISKSSLGAFLGGAFVASQFTSVASAEGEKHHALSPAEWRSFRVLSNEKLTHNTHLVRFEFPSENDTSGMKVASFIMAKASVNGKNVIKPYTPTSAPTQTGFLDLVVKGYPDGALSKHIVELQPGEALDMKGPLLKFAYQPNSRKHIGLVAGGSGITPMLQVALEILRNPDDHTQVTLIFANNTEDDIILRDELAAYESMYPGLKVIHILSNPSESWTGLKGFVNKELLEKHMPAPATDSLVCVCGPPGMMAAVSGGKAKDFSQGQLEGMLKELNYTSDMVFKF